MGTVIELASCIYTIHDQLEVLKTYDEFEKLYVYNNKLFIDKSYKVFQPITRMIYGYGRELIYTFLNIVLGNYIKYIYSIIQYETIYATEIEQLRCLRNVIKNFNNEIKIGLLALQVVYSDYSELIGLLNSTQTLLKGIEAKL